MTTRKTYDLNDPFDVFAKEVSEEAAIARRSPGAYSPSEAEQKARQNKRAATLKQYTLEKDKHFDAVLKDILEIFSLYESIASKMRAAQKTHGKGVSMTYTTSEGKFIAISSREVDAMRRQLRDRIKNLYKYWIHSKKTKRQKIEPSEMKGSHSRVWIAPCLVKFFTSTSKDESAVGLADPNDKDSGALIDKMPLLRMGWTMKSNLVSLFYLHVHTFNLKREVEGENQKSNHIVCSKIMMKTLGGEMALYQPKYNSEGVRVNVLNKDKTMTTLKTLVETSERAARNPLKNKKGEDKATVLFPEDPKKTPFPSYYFQSMISLNVVETKKIATVAKDNGVLAAALKELQGWGSEDQIKAQLLEEYAARKAAAEVWAKINAPLKKERAFQRRSPQQ